MDKHAMKGPINETLEKHYQSRIKELEEKLEEAKSIALDLEMQLDRKIIEVDVANAKAEEFSKALAEVTTKAVLGGVKL